MKTKSLLAVLLLSFMAFMALTVSGSAWAFHISPVAGLNRSQASKSPDVAGQTVGTRTGYALGVLVDLPFVPFFDLETGVLYSVQKPTLETSTAVLVETYKSYRIPMIVQFSLLDTLSVGAGFYYSMATGDVDLEMTPTDGSAGFSTSASYEARSIKKSDFGLLFSAGFKYPLIPTLKLLIKAELEKGLINRYDNPAYPEITVKNGLFQILAGVSFGI